MYVGKSSYGITFHPDSKEQTRNLRRGDGTVCSGCDNRFGYLAGASVRNGTGPRQRGSQDSRCLLSGIVDAAPVHHADDAYHRAELGARLDTVFQERDHPAVAVAEYSVSVNSFGSLCPRISTGVWESL